jgi:Fe-S-cluster-containing dehydrogenase component
MGKVFVVDVGICNGCYCCQIACKDEHVGNDWNPYAKPQPDTGHFWLRLNEYIRGTVPKVKMHYIPVMCQQCDNAPCLEACKVEGAMTKREDGVIIINPEKCTGCKNCVDACPYGAIFFNEDLNLAQKCTGCSHLIDEGWEEPRCVDACPTEALKYGEESDFKDLIAKAESLKPELGSRPRVYYLNIPKKFIGGTIYDPVAKEVIVGATCTLSGPKASQKRTITDGFGDFWFEGLETGKYTLKIDAKGFVSKSFADLSTEKDVNLGDIALT